MAHTIVFAQAKKQENKSRGEEGGKKCSVIPPMGPWTDGHNWDLWRREYVCTVWNTFHHFPLLALKIDWLWNFLKHVIHFYFTVAQVFLAVSKTRRQRHTIYSSDKVPCDISSVGPQNADRTIHAKKRGKPWSLKFTFLLHAMMMKKSFCSICTSHYFLRKRQTRQMTWHH